jgi:xylulokinase
VDLGTSALKAALVSFRGVVQAWASRPLRVELGADGSATQSPRQWRLALCAVARQLLSDVATAQSVRAISCSTQGEGTVPVDRDGNPLLDCITWMDMRGAPHLRARFRGLINPTGAGLRRTLRWIRLTGGMPSMTGKDPAGHMLLVRSSCPAIYEKTHKFLNVLDYLNLWLTGRCVATYDSILTSWVTDNRDPDNIRYHDALVRSCGVDREKLPEIVPCTEVLGTLRPQAALELGLPASVRVVAGAIDNTAAAVGSGAVADHDAHLYLGTSSWIAAHVPFKKTDPVSALASVPCAVPHRYLLTALQATAGGNLVFLRDTLLYPGGAPPDAFAKMDLLAAGSPPGSNGVVYTPWIWGERAPVEDLSLRAGLQNLSLRSTRADIVRSVLEGVALNARWLLGPVERFLGRTVPSIRLVGGGATSDLWCRIMADILGRPAMQVDAPAQANARGAAFIAAVGLGEMSFADVPSLVHARSVYEPDAKTVALYTDRYERFREIYDGMRKVYRRMNA